MAWGAIYTQPLCSCRSAASASRKKGKQKGEEERKERETEREERKEGERKRRRRTGTRNGRKERNRIVPNVPLGCWWDKANVPLLPGFWTGSEGFSSQVPGNPSSSRSVQIHVGGLFS